MSSNEADILSRQFDDVIEFIAQNIPTTSYQPNSEMINQFQDYLKAMRQQQRIPNNVMDNVSCDSAPMRNYVPITLIPNNTDFLNHHRDRKHHIKNGQIEMMLHIIINRDLGNNYLKKMLLCQLFVENVNQKLLTLLI